MDKKWETEPNDKEFDSNGYKCVVKRHPSLGHLCGYVHIPKSHPLWGKSYDELYELGVNVDVHGGLTFSDQEGDAWVFGFDCAHFGDLVPSTLAHDFGIGDVYRDMEYVTAETKSLAEQLQVLSRKVETR